MTKTITARRYAKALLELSLEQQALEPVRTDLRDLAALLAAAPELAWLVRHSPLSVENKQAQLRALFAGRVHPLTLRFLLFITGRHRLNRLDAMLTAFEEFCDAHAGVVRVRVTTARPLTEDLRRALTDRLAAQAARPLKTVVDTDPALLGGFQVRIGDLVHDYSLAAQLEALQQQWLQAAGP